MSLVTGEDSIALGPNKLVYTFLVAQFLMSTGKPETHPANTHTNTLTHTHTATHTHADTCLFVLVCCPWFRLLTFLCRSILTRSATFKSNQSNPRFLLFLLLAIFPFHFCIFFSVFLFLFLSPRFLHFLCCCHCTLRQLLWRLSTKICCNFSCLA